MPKLRLSKRDTTPKPLRSGRYWAVCKWISIPRSVSEVPVANFVFETVAYKRKIYMVFPLMGGTQYQSNELRRLLKMLGITVKEEPHSKFSFDTDDIPRCLKRRKRIRLRIILDETRSSFIPDKILKRNRVVYFSTK